MNFFKPVNFLKFQFIFFLCFVSLNFGFVLAENPSLKNLKQVSISNPKFQKCDFPDAVFVNNQILIDKEKIFWLTDDKTDKNNFNILLRFDDLDLPVEAQKIHLKISFQTKQSQSTNVRNFPMKLTYVNPVNGAKYNKILNSDIFSNLNNFKNFKNFMFVAEDYIDRDFFSEKGDILIYLENVDQTQLPILGIDSESFLISGLDAGGLESYAGNTGIFFPTAEISKQSILNWNTFVYAQNTEKIGMNLSTIFLPRKNTDKEHSKCYLLLDLKYCLMQETMNQPSISGGMIITDALINTDELSKKNTYDFYITSSKNLTKVLNSSLGFMHGNFFNIFENDVKKVSIKTTDFLFYDMLLRLSSNTAIKFETGYDFSGQVEIYSVAYSFSLFKNFISFDVGTSMTGLAKDKNNDLFLVCRLKI